MVSYPIVIRFFGDNRRRSRVLFPDFPGCRAELPASTGQEYDQLIQAAQRAANDYLGGQDGQPGWIEKRLRYGRRIDPPFTQTPLTFEEDQLELLADICLAPNLALALEFHWLRLELGRTLVDMARLLFVPTDRYRQIEQCWLAPNHKEKARLRNLQTRSQRIPSRSLPHRLPDRTGSDEESDEAASF